MRDLGGSFYDFETRRLNGCALEVVALPPDDWDGRAALEWLRKLSLETSYDPDCEKVVSVARVLNEICARARVQR